MLWNDFRKEQTPENTTLFDMKTENGKSPAELLGTLQNAIRDLQTWACGWASSTYPCDPANRRAWRCTWTGYGGRMVKSIGHGYRGDIIAGLTGIGHAYLWVESSPVGPMALIAGVVVLAILLYVNVPHKWIIEVPFWFVVTAAVLGVIGGRSARREFIRR